MEYGSPYQKCGRTIPNFLYYIMFPISNGMNNKEQNFWNFIFSVFFIALLILGGYLIYGKFNGLPTFIKPFDFILIALATFRVVRLFVYDKITNFIREPLSLVQSGPLKTAYELMICPWCFGVWAAFSLVFFYFYFYLWFWWVILALAVAALGTFMQLLSTMIGWRAEILKMEAQSKGSEEKSAGTCGVK